MNNRDFRNMLRDMPALRHKLPGQEYDIDKSEVMEWVLVQPGAKEWVWNRVKALEALAYDEVTGTWSGIPWLESRANPEQPYGGRPKKFTNEDVLSAIQAVMPFGTEAMKIDALRLALTPYMIISDPTLRRHLRRLQAEGKVKRWNWGYSIVGEGVPPPRALPKLPKDASLEKLLEILSPDAEHMLPRDQIYQAVTEVFPISAGALLDRLREMVNAGKAGRVFDKKTDCYLYHWKGAEKQALTEQSPNVL